MNSTEELAVLQVCIRLSSLTACIFSHSASVVSSPVYFDVLCKTCKERREKQWASYIIYNQLIFLI